MMLACWGSDWPSDKGRDVPVFFSDWDSPEGRGQVESTKELSSCSHLNRYFSPRKRYLLVADLRVHLPVVHTKPLCPVFLCSKYHTRSPLRIRLPYDPSLFHFSYLFSDYGRRCRAWSCWGMSHWSSFGSIPYILDTLHAYL